MIFGASSVAAGLAAMVKDHNLHYGDEGEDYDNDDHDRYHDLDEDHDDGDEDDDDNHDNGLPANIEHGGITYFQIPTK